MIKQILLVATGGAVGSVLRFLASVFVVRMESFPFPAATFLVNILGCFCIGLFANLIPGNSMRFLLITGFCGGFTTFSTFASETLTLFNNNQILPALLYTLGSCVLGIGAVWLGMYITK
ncbi:MAG: fluoride efflux transporter CrcB [Prevotella sp.]|jgi:CrcB protein|nr:fluoride efflux transporter CrcB [Prevotella sp.]